MGISCICLYMAFSWRADNGPTLNVGFVIFQGIQTSTLRNPVALLFAGSGGSGNPAIHPSGSAHVSHAVL